MVYKLHACQKTKQFIFLQLMILLKSLVKVTEEFDETIESVGGAPQVVLCLYGVLHKLCCRCCTICL